MTSTIRQTQENQINTRGGQQYQGGSSERGLGQMKDLREEINDVETSIRGRVSESGKARADVRVRTVEHVDTEGLRRLETRISKERSAIVDAERRLQDEKSLHKEAMELTRDKLNQANQLERLTTQKKSDVERFIAEERRLEDQRADMHRRAVSCENERAEIKAKSVLARKEAEISQKLARQHEYAAEQAQALIDAHRMALSELEKKREWLQKPEIEVEVLGDMPEKQEPIDIDVKVKPKHLQEYRVASAGEGTGASARAHIEEKLPTRSKANVPARQIRTGEEKQHEETYTFTK